MPLVAGMRLECIHDIPGSSGTVNIRDRGKPFDKPEIHETGDCCEGRGVVVDVVVVSLAPMFAFKNDRKTLPKSNPGGILIFMIGELIGFLLVIGLEVMTLLTERESLNILSRDDSVLGTVLGVVEVVRAVVVDVLLLVLFLPSLIK